MIVYRELTSLCRDLNIPAAMLYAVSNTLPRHYRKAELPKRSGGTRQLLVPDPLLKHIQRRILQMLLVHMPVSRHATAYRYGGSTLRNAAPHVGKAMILKLDIRDFFDSILYSQVKDAAFPPEVYGEPLRVLLAMLCYCHDALPQGAPTSPAITNILLREFDDTVGSWCAGRGIAYTRYCDDMTFSGDFDLAEVRIFVSAQLRKLGFFLNEGKTVVARGGQRQTVTGIVVNQKTNLPADYRRRLRQELYYCRKYGLAQHAARKAPGCAAHTYGQRLLGQVSYALHITPGDAALRQAKTWLLQQLKTEE